MSGRERLLWRAGGGSKVVLAGLLEEVESQQAHEG